MDHGLSSDECHRAEAGPSVAPDDNECVEQAPINKAAFEAEFKKILMENYVAGVTDEVISVDDVLCETCRSFFADVAYFPCGHVGMCDRLQCEVLLLQLCARIARYSWRLRGCWRLTSRWPWPVRNAPKRLSTATL